MTRTTLLNLKLLQKAFLQEGKDRFTFSRRYDPKADRGNLDYIAEKHSIPLVDDSITRYLIQGVKIQGLTKTLEERRPKLGIITSYEEVEEALEFVIKNFTKI